MNFCCLLDLLFVRRFWCMWCSFVRLLEFAEDELKCSHIIVCFRKDRPDRGIAIGVTTYH